MVIIKNKNLSFTQPVCENGDTFESCNLHQLNPNTIICDGKTGLVFKNCNLINCQIPPDSTTENCNTTQINRCYWLHPEWPLEEEGENCMHVIDVDEVWMDDVLVQTFYVREDLKV